jgi:hypothetical protein
VEVVDSEVLPRALIVELQRLLIHRLVVLLILLLRRRLQKIKLLCTVFLEIEILYMLILSSRMIFQRIF